ncbi:MAG: hypothetical protein AABX02_05445 [archaeon]
MHPVLETAFLRAQHLDKWFWIFFGIFLSLQLYWRTILEWDYLVYALNGDWFCGEKVFFEFLRPPLPSFLHCVFGATDFSPFLVVLFSCILYFIGVILFFDLHAKTEKINPFYFSAFSFLFPTILIHSNAGGDILALGLLLIAYSIEGVFFKGLFFGLSTLSRYNYFFFLPILLLQKKWRAWPIIFLGIFIIWSPWLYYNFSQVGDPLFSVSESIALNVQQKGILQPFSIMDMVLVVFFGVSTLLAFLSRSLGRLPFSWGVITIIQYWFSGIKETRFLISLVPLQALFLSRFVVQFPKWEKIMAGLLLVCLLVNGYLLFYYITNPYRVDVPTDPFLYNCRVLTDKWVHFYEEGIIAEPLPPPNDWMGAVQRGNHLVIYRREGYSPDLFSSFETIDRGSYIIVKSNACVKPSLSFISNVWKG